MHFELIRDFRVSPGIKKYFPNNQLVEQPLADHFFQEDEPEIVVEELQRFLKS